jgi:asparagine synthase (glutamine-hydrolysing)
MRFDRPEEYVERFRAIFDAAVGDRLRSNRVATHLSGGMDSTSVAATARMLLASRGDFEMRAYTIVHERLMIEREGPLAEVVAESLDLPLERIVAEGCEPPPRVAQPRPFASNQNVQHELGRRAASFARSVLTGMGGDPLFHVVPRWRAVPRQWRATLRSAMWRRRIRAGRLPELPSWIGPEFARRAELPARWRDLWSSFQPRKPADRMTHPYWESMFSVAHPGAHPLASRTLFPFFDLRLATFVWETPTRWHPGKRLLREAMRDRLPQVILERPKTAQFVGTGRPDPTDPAYRLALEPAVRQWRRKLMAATRLSEYVDVREALELVDAPMPVRQPPLFDNCLALAHWLDGEGDRLYSAGRATLRAESQHVRD